MNGQYDYALEKRLRANNPELHKRFTDTVFVLQHILSNFKLIFPYFTDHSELHSLNVIDFCNKIIGEEITKMNDDEIYCLLVGCYFHDTGMGISMKDFEAFSQDIDFGDYFETHDRNDVQRIVRDFHNEYSGLFIKKYADLFEIPSKEHLNAIVQISRGHRKTNLKDIFEYPLDYKVPNGNTICLPYLAAMIRLADEIDVTAARNSHLLYDIPDLIINHNEIEFTKHEAVRDLIVEKDRFVMTYNVKEIDTFGADEQELENSLKVLVSKMQKTLDYCIDATKNITKFEIHQKVIVAQKI